MRDHWTAGKGLRPVDPEEKETIGEFKMAIGESIEGCAVDWTDSVSKKNASRRLESVRVYHVGKNTVQFVRPRYRQVVTKMTTGKHLRIRAPDGRDVVALWTERETPAVSSVI